MLQALGSLEFCNGKADVSEVSKCVGDVSMLSLAFSLLDLFLRICIVLVLKESFRSPHDRLLFLPRLQTECILDSSFAVSGMAFHFHGGIFCSSADFTG